MALITRLVAQILLQVPAQGPEDGAVDGAVPDAGPASENASRLAAMQRADRNIADLLTTWAPGSTGCARVASTKSCST